MRLSTLIPLVTLAVGCTTYQPSPQDIAGVYKACSYACTTIELSADFTFKVHYEGDLHGGESIPGEWRFDDKGQIVANSLAQPSLNSGIERKIEGISGLVVAVTFDAEAVPGAEATVFCRDRRIQQNTDIKGEVLFEGCAAELVEVRFDDTLHARHEVADPASNHLALEVDLSASSYITEETWVVRRRGLYYFTVDEDGKIHRSTTLKRQ